MRASSGSWTSHRRRRICAAALAGGTLLVRLASAAPFTPSSDHEVLERLPQRSSKPWEEIAAMRLTLAERREDARLAATLAGRYLALHRGDGDPRLVAYARAALAPWDGRGDAPAEIVLQRALVAQTEHRFDAAAADLALVTRQRPRDPQAWLASAALALTRGELQGSRGACARTLLLVDPMVSGSCLAAVDAMTGRAREAYAFLTRVLAEQGAELDPPLAEWVATLAAETAVALDLPADADRHFRAALEAVGRDGEPPSVYSLAAYTDFLIDRGAAQRALEVLEDAPPADPLLLRRARVKRRVGASAAEEIEALRYRLALSLDGTEDTHAREAAYLALHLIDEPHRALALALANWRTQHEPIDARLVMEAALAADEADAAVPVVRWLEAHGVEHAVLARLVAALGGAP